MKQLLQDLQNGKTFLADQPLPSLEPGHLLIRTTATLVSQGTERMLVEFGRASLFRKARSQPEKVKQVIEKMKTDGFLPTLEAVFRKLGEPLPLGYCNAGVVIGVGAGVREFSVGDRVASNGPHAEVVSVAANLAAKVPPEVSDEAAAFTVIGAVALQGVRLAAPEFGETVVVVGLGLVGQLTGQLLCAAGCDVIGFDFDAKKVEIASRLGIRAFQSGGELDPVRCVSRLTEGAGADAAIITASSSSDQVISETAQMMRKRGRIILVGVVGLALNRADFYQKELTFQVSCSYGPGRYESAYEDRGLDYPVAFVRWTANRNFQAVLTALANGRLKTESLVSRRVSFEQFAEVYDAIGNADLASVLTFSREGPSLSVGAPVRPTGQDRPPGRVSGRPAVAVVGSGNFAKMTAVPALIGAGAAIKTVVSARGITGTALAARHGISQSSTDFAEVLRDDEIRAVIIATRHNLHAGQVVAALDAGKYVLVEKPLCLSLAELSEIEDVLSQTENAAARLTVGYNRRFSPYVRKAKELLGTAPRSLIFTINAGAVPSDHWVHDPAVGGGRLVSEACHFIDLAIFLTGSPVTALSAVAMDPRHETAAIVLRHADASITNLNYLANGHRSFPKEGLEIFCDGRVLLLDNFRDLRGFGFKNFSRLKGRQDKGHQQQFHCFLQHVADHGTPVIPWAEIANGMRATLLISQAIVERRWVSVDG